MIKTVGSIELDTYSSKKSIAIFLPLVIFPLSLIFTITTPQLSWYASIIFLLFSIVSTLGIMLFVIERKEVALSYFLVFFLSILIIKCCVDTSLATHTYLYYFQTAVFIFSIYFLITHAAIILEEFKRLLFSRFIKKKNIKLYASTDDISNKVYNNYWSPINPFNIKFFDKSNDKAVITDNSTYISIRSTATKNTQQAFSPILRLISCREFFKDANNRQSYFNTVYFALVLINFIYFFSALFMTKTLFLLHLRQEFIYLFMVVIILGNLFLTMYLFIKHLHFPECSEENIQDNLKNNINEFTHIDKHYLTINDKNKYFHDDELIKLRDANTKLLSKLDSIYQIATPILFLSQITLSIAMINYFKDSTC